MLARPLRLLIGKPRAVSYFHTSSAVWGRKTIQRFNLADIGEGITECEVIKWSVKPSSPIASFDPLCEVQSDKASVEITSPFDGIVKELLIKEGEIAKVGSALCLIEVEEEDGEEGAVEESSADTPAPQAQQSPLQTREEIHPLPTEPATPARKLHPMDPNFISSSARDVLAAPSVRHFARKQGVELASVPGTGKGGRVEKSDVEAFISSQSSKAEVEQNVVVGKQEEDVVVELGRTRYGMWKAMVKSLDIPHFGYSTTLDLTPLDKLMYKLSEHIPPHYLLPSDCQESSSQLISPSAFYPVEQVEIPKSAQYKKLTMLPILLKTLSKAMEEWPLFRASITPSSDSSTKPTLTIRPNADISIALSTPTGLYTPTIQSVNSQSIYDLASRLKHLSHLGRQVPSQLTPKEMPKRGGTITVSNVGAIGAGDFAHPILVPGGGVAIVALGRAKWVWDVADDHWYYDATGEYVHPEDNKGGQRRLKMGISWSADHRVVEGAEMAAFVECWRGWVEKPEKIIAAGV
ncbi:2-oxoacid dehydrogenases acyltransferase-domain-containing protein [Cyathus striatus]|nr:2-oxoacid dehydrogenases acyltransferase-domain-containing protein [Cyathus striatus]